MPKSFSLPQQSTVSENIFTSTASFRFRRLHQGDKPGEKVTDNTDKDSDWPRLILKGSLLNEFKPDLLTPFEHVLYVTV